LIFQVNEALLQAFGGKQAHVDREPPGPKQSDSKPPPETADGHIARVSQAKQKMVEIWVNNSLQQAKAALEVALNARRIVEEGLTTIQKSLMLANDQNISIEMVEKAVERIHKETDIILTEATKGQNSILVVQKASSEARSNGPNLPNTLETVSMVGKVTEQVKIVISMANEAKVIVRQADDILAIRKIETAT